MQRVGEIQAPLQAIDRHQDRIGVNAEDRFVQPQRYRSDPIPGTDRY